MISRTTFLFITITVLFFLLSTTTAIIVSTNTNTKSNNKRVKIINDAINKCRADYKKHKSTGFQSKDQLCAAYQCLENIFHCDTEDTYWRNRYLIQYGKHFCEVAVNELDPWLLLISSNHNNNNNNNENNNNIGHLWSQGTRTCLQETLLASVNASSTCRDIAYHAFDSHLGCYTYNNPSGLNFRENLSFVERGKVYWSMRSGMLANMYFLFSQWGCNKLGITFLCQNDHHSSQAELSRFSDL